MTFPNLILIIFLEKGAGTCFVPTDVSIGNKNHIRTDYARYSWMQSHNPLHLGDRYNRLHMVPFYQ